MAVPADTSEYVIVTPTSGRIYVSSVSRPDNANETHYTRGETMFRHTSKDTLFIKTAPNDLVFEQRATKLELVAVGYDEEGWTQTEPQYITVRQNPAGVFTGFYFRWKQSIEYDYEGTYEGRHYSNHTTSGVDYEFSTSYDNHGTLESERNGDIVTMHYYGTQYNGEEYDINLTVDTAKRKLLGGYFSIGTWSGDFEEKENFDSDKKVKIINLNSTTWKNYESVNISTETVCNSLTPY